VRKVFERNEIGPLAFVLFLRLVGMDADPMVREGDVRNVGRNLRHVTRRTIVVPLALRARRDVQPARTFGMALQTLASVVCKRILGRRRMVRIVATGAA